MNTSYKTRRDLRIISIIIFIGILLGIGISSVLAKSFTIKNIIIGGGFGFFITFLCAIGNFGFLVRFSRLPFTLYILIKSIYFTLVTSAVMFVRLFIFNDIMMNPLQKVFFLLAAVLMTLIIAIIINFIIMLRRMLGQNAMSNFFTGRYHTPVEENRIFMFLDIVSSTTIAENIGHLKFHKLLDDFFYDITEDILRFGGEIYKYVGDEVILNWQILSETKNIRSIYLFFEIKQHIDTIKNKYIKKYELVPGFRAGVHCGPVIVGEMGDFKREIAFLGDTVNTTARIQESCKTYNRDLILSSDLMDKITLPLHYESEYLGEIELRGKEKAVGLYSIHEKVS